LSVRRRNETKERSSLRLCEKLEFLSVSDRARAGDSSQEVFFLAKPQRKAEHGKARVIPLALKLRC